MQIRVLNMKIAEDDKDVSYRLPLPGRSKAQMEADSDSDEGDDSPAFDSMLERFKKLQAKASKSSLGDYLELPKEIGEISLSSSLRSGVKETDLYLKTEGDLVVCKRNTTSKVNDVSGAALSDFKPHVGKRKLKKLKRAEREKTKGSDWYNMPATELTEERKKDLELLQMRNVLDPKRFYKKNNSETLPKYFQIGTVVDSASDFYTDRVAKKDRKQTMVDELLADAEFKKYQKRKYVQIIDDKIKKEGKFFHKKKKKH